MDNHIAQKTRVAPHHLTLIIYFLVLTLALFGWILSPTLLRADTAKQITNGSADNSELLKKTRFIVRKTEEKTITGNSEEELEMDSLPITLRSMFDTTNTPQRNPLGYSEESPVRVQIKSTSIKQSPSWYRRDVTVPVEKPGTIINLSSPLSVRSLSPHK